MHIVCFTSRRFKTGVPVPWKIIKYMRIIAQPLPPELAFSAAKRYDSEIRVTLQGFPENRLLWEPASFNSSVSNGSVFSEMYHAF